MKRVLVRPIIPEIKVEAAKPVERRRNARKQPSEDISPLRKKEKEGERRRETEAKSPSSFPFDG